MSAARPRPSAAFIKSRTARRFHARSVRRAGSFPTSRVVARTARSANRRRQAMSARPGVLTSPMARDRSGTNARVPSRDRARQGNARNVHSRSVTANAPRAGLKSLRVPAPAAQGPVDRDRVDRDLVASNPADRGPADLNLMGRDQGGPENRAVPARHAASPDAPCALSAGDCADAC